MLLQSVYLVSDAEFNGVIENHVLLVLSITQKWGVMITTMAAMMCWGLGHVFKIRKNVKVKQTFNFWSIGMLLLTVIFTFLPYVVMHFLEQKG